jgi:hypothetical protein
MLMTITSYRSVARLLVAALNSVLTEVRVNKCSIRINCFSVIIKAGSTAVKLNNYARGLPSQG